MSRRGTGTVWRVDASGRPVDAASPDGVAWLARITLPRKFDGTPGARPYVDDIDPNLTEKQAKAYVAAVAEAARRGGGVYVGRERAKKIGANGRFVMSSTSRAFFTALAIFDAISREYDARASCDDVRDVAMEVARRCLDVFAEDRDFIELRIKKSEVAQ